MAPFIYPYGSQPIIGRNTKWRNREGSGFYTPSSEQTCSSTTNLVANLAVQSTHTDKLADTVRAQAGLATPVLHPLTCPLSVV